MKRSKPTMQDIANAAGVSKATVSMVLNKKDDSISQGTRERILAIADELQYIPNSIARSLSTNKSGTIGIMLPDITNPFFSQIARAVEDAASKYDYNVIFCNMDNDMDKEVKYTKLLVSKLVDGVIFVTGGRSPESVNILEGNQIPFVFVDRNVQGFEHYSGVYCLNKEGSYEGVNYLYKKGKRKIAFVTGDKTLSISKLRLEGFMESAKKLGIYRDDWVFYSDFTIEGGRMITEKVIKTCDGIDTIFYSNDLMAIGGMKTLMTAGIRIPEDIGVMGYDDIAISGMMNPALTTIHQPIYDMGKQSCRLLIKHIRGQLKKQKIIRYAPEILERQSI